MPELVNRFGLPQEWNKDGHLGPDRYIEAQIWDDEPLKEFIRAGLCDRLAQGISHIHSEAYAGGELKHGTIALVEKGTLVVSMMPQDILVERRINCNTLAKT